ncbi:3,4-dihydroxy-2-butanone 4-phosphate synthase [Sphingorhabdus lutea]|uniref:3,4-dihydroxy-2-butanone 4-phosphate synthase n=1 Tax=Sphingorhabdus lutea TaxID=1913578 RepID=A0A1L3J978_9SPHN|nr:3,4-dihydroxy-2-butanone-4-phosphate synthase [Sphingorhabdus lutea]APG61689.1 3,4-dihydroxy-2-butanone 4-phosphate synthase [Sphingorhabdus lutea]
MSDIISQAIAQLKNGGIVILTGDNFRHGDIDFIAPAKNITADSINFMAKHGRGLICLGMTPSRAGFLNIGHINDGDERYSGRPHGRSIEAKEGVETGISAADRAQTILVAANENSSADDLVSPGHVFPLIAHAQGLSARNGALEAAIALCQKAEMGDMAVLCSIMRDDGSMARATDMAEFAAEHGLPIIDISQLKG